MIHRCPTFSEAGMGKINKVMVFYKVSYWNSLEPNHKEVEEPLVTDNLEVPKQIKIYLMWRKEKYNYDDQLYQTAHKAKEKVPVMTQMGINMVREMYVISKYRERRKGCPIQQWTMKHVLDKRRRPAGWYRSFFPNEKMIDITKSLCTQQIGISS